jgi:hypothetical protein
MTENMTVVGPDPGIVRVECDPDDGPRISQDRLACGDSQKRYTSHVGVGHHGLI